MPAKKSTNKTAHVLSLLSNANEEPETSIKEPDSPNSPPPARPLVPPIVENLRVKDEAVSENIRSALETELLKSEEEPISAPANPKPTHKPENAPDSGDKGGTLKPSSEKARTMTAPSAQSAEDQKTADPKENKIADENDFVCLDVMRNLVDSNAPKYMDMFDVCKCPRCCADVRALALTNLQSKYIVVDKSQMIPLLTLYEERYKASISVQLIKACKTVKAKPHHNR